MRRTLELLNTLAVNATEWLRTRAYDFWIGIKPYRFGVLVVLLLAFLLLESVTGQGRDVLSDYGTAGFGSRADLRQHAFLWLFTLSFALLVWWLCRVAGKFRFVEERSALLRYRELFPRYPLDKDQFFQANVIKDEARSRVRRIIQARVWVPRILGALVPLMLAIALWKAAGWVAVVDILILAGLAVVVWVFVTMRRSFQNRVAEKMPNKKEEIPLFGRINLRQLFETDNAEEIRTTWQGLGRSTTYLMYLICVIVFISALWAILYPINFGKLFGPVPVLLLALTILLMVGTTLVMVSRRSNFPWGFVVVGGLIFLAAFNRHEMRFLPDPGDAVSKRVTPAELAREFVESVPDSKPDVVVLVATAGGGSRAAYWTATVLGELSKSPKFKDRLLLISGVSGGALGALFYKAARVAAPNNPDLALNIANAAASGDFLSPALSSMLLRDLFIGSPLPDRAAIMERAWSESFNDACREHLNAKACPVDLEKGFMQLWSEDDDPWPALILNGTVVETGGRAVASSLKLHCHKEHETCSLVDVADLIAYNEGDLVASSAANVSARFPIVGPSARVGVTPKGDERSIVDGGYFDNFGAVTLHQVAREMWPEFKDKQIIPVVIQITSDPEFNFPEDVNGRLAPSDIEPGGHQIFEPVETIRNLRSSFGRQGLLELRRKAEEHGTYFHFGQCLTKSGSAPLAWVISQRSQSILDNAIEQCPSNRENLERLAKCLEDPNTCQEPTLSR